ncbi:MAG: ABC transporter ATP-binding protein [Alphaproteobacteria bacterium]|nr:ABC transporter ATP-binding protein [Alphaproteobacteria bacterium]
MSLLATQGLSRRYGGLSAVDGVDFALDAGEIRTLIGPNGAGKTTLVGMICGRIPASAGRIAFEGADITDLAAWHRVSRGIAYTFQITSVFTRLSCFDNVVLAVQRSRSWARRSLWPGHEAEIAADVMAALERVGLAGRRDTTAGMLSYGHQRLLEVAIGLALRPKLLILDEPTQGLAEDEIVDFCKLVRQIAREATVLLIEHNMAVVMELAARITVMDRGRILAEGTPAEIRADERVRTAYLGT